MYLFYSFDADIIEKNDVMIDKTARGGYYEKEAR